MPPNDKARVANIGLWVLFGCHIIMVGIKMYLLGLFSGLSDIIAIIILLIANIRYDYCGLMCYIVINLFEVFALIVVLGYYLQTDMGTNVPNKDESQAPNRGDKDNKNDDKKHAFGLGAGKKTNAVHIIFRGLYNNYLKWKYNFY